MRLWSFACGVVLLVGCGGRALDTGGGTPAGDGGTVPLPQRPSLPPAAGAGATFRPCGVMSPLPEILGVTATGEVALLAGNGRPLPAYVHLFSRAAGRVTSTLALAMDDTSVMLTRDGRHLVTSKRLYDLATGVATPHASGTDSLDISASGDFVLALDRSVIPGTAASVVKRVLATDAVTQLVPARGDRTVLAGALMDNGTHFLLLVGFPDATARTGSLWLELRRLADGALERSPSVDNGGAIVDGFVVPANRRLLTTTGGYALLRFESGTHAVRLPDGATVWKEVPGFTQFQLSPKEGIVVYRAVDSDTWQVRDLAAGANLGALPASITRTYVHLPSGVDEAGLAFTPDGAEVVFEDDALRVARADGSGSIVTTPIKGGGWSGRSVFVSSTEIVSIESTSIQGTGVRKRSVPGGEVLAELGTSEWQSEWDGDVALSPDGKSIAVALPERVHVLRVSDLKELATIPRAAGRVAWSADGGALVTTPDLHYRDMERPVAEAAPMVEIWGADGRLERGSSVPFIPTFATFTDDGRALLVTGRDQGMPLAGQHYTAVDLVGPFRAVRVDRVSGTTSAMTDAPLASDPGRHFGTDLTGVIRFEDGTRIASLDLPAPPISASDEVPPRVAGLSVRFHRPTFSPDGALLADLVASVTGGTTVAIYEAATGKRLDVVPLELGEAQASLTFSPDGRKLGVEEWGGSGLTTVLCAGN